MHPGFPYINSHKIIEYGAEYHEEDVYRLTPAVEDDAGDEQNAVSRFLRQNVIQKHYDRKKIEEKNNAAK